MNGKTFAAVLGLSLIWAIGCDAKKDIPKPDDKQKDGDHGHGTGPHEGVVFDFGGGKYHEFKPSHSKKDATV